MPSPRRVTVVGAGVVGLAVAHEFARGGDQVSVLAAAPAADTVSAVAGAIWFPYATETSAASLRWLAASRVRFEELAADPATGVDLREGTVVERRPDSDRSWTTAVTKPREATAAQLPPGATGGVRVRLPVVSVPEYLAWLYAACTGLGVVFHTRTVSTIADVGHDLAADLVVVAAGLGSGPLLGDDDTSYPIRGQVVRLANPGLTEWLLDDHHPAGMTYVIPRRHDVVCGGTADVGALDTTVDPATEAAILARSIELVPALAGQPVLSRAVGLRPARAALRVQRVTGHAVPVFCCYGHGGAGVTMSWGCAAEIVALAAAVPG